MADTTVIVRPSNDIKNYSVHGSDYNTPGVGGAAAALSTGTTMWQILNNSLGAAAKLTGWVGSQAATANVITNNGTCFQVGFATASIPALAIVKNVELLARCSVTNTFDFQLEGYPPYPLCSFKLFGYGGRQIIASGVTGGIAVTASGTADVASIDAGGGSITAVDLNQFVCEICQIASGYQRTTGGGVRPTWNTSVNVSQWFQLWLVVSYNQAPVATATGPTGTVTTPSPTVTWTYADPESDVQERFQVKVFNSAQYGALGFNPDTFTADADSGVVFSSATSYTLTALLSNTTTYRAYVKVADVGSSGRFGAWAFSSFTSSYTGPNPPTFTSTVDNVNNRVSLALTASGTGLSTGYFEVQRSIDNVNWTPIRVSPITNTGGTITVLDYEAPINIPVWYRGRSVNITTPTIPIGSTWVTPASVTLVETMWWLKDPLSSTLNGKVLVTDFSRDRNTPSGVYRPPNKRTAVVIRQPFSGDSGTMTIQACTPDVVSWPYMDTHELDLLLQPGHTLLLQRITSGDQWYIQIGSKYTPNAVGGTSKQFGVTFDWIEVDAP